MSSINSIQASMAGYKPLVTNNTASNVAKPQNQKSTNQVQAAKDPDHDGDTDGLGLDVDA
jgi:hypothetical protein